MKIGEQSLRSLLIISATSFTIKHHTHREVRPGTWLVGLFKRKLQMLVHMALANKLAHIVEVLIARGGVCLSPAAVA